MNEELPLEVEFVDRVDAIPPEAWAACFPPPLEGRFWYQTLHASGLEDQFQFLYGVLRLGGRIVGIAPCFRHDVPLTLVAPAPVAFLLRGAALAYPPAGRLRTFFVGSPCADEGTIGLAPGHGLATVIEPLARAVGERARALGASLVVFKDFNAGDVAALRRAPGFTLFPSYPGAVVRLPAPDKDAYYRSLAHKQRYNLQKKLRRSTAAFALDTQVIARPSDGELNDILALFLQTYERGRTKFERLNRSFFAAVREQPEARFIVQREHATGRMVAFMLVFVAGRRVINKFIGLDYAVARTHHLYFRLFDAALDFAYAAGAGEIQSGQTGYSAKLELGHHLVPLVNAVRHRHPVVHAVFSAVVRRITWASLDDDLAGWLRAHPERDWRIPAGAARSE